MKTKPFSEQIAIVTGGGTGIGRAFAEALAQAEATAVIASRREEVLKQTAAELNSKFSAARVVPFGCDVLDRDQIEALVSFAFERWNCIDILINNAGLDHQCVIPGW